MGREYIFGPQMFSWLGSPDLEELGVTDRKKVGDGFSLASPSASSQMFPVGLSKKLLSASTLSVLPADHCRGAW